MDIKKKSLENINFEIGKEVTNIKKCVEMKAELENRRIELEKSLLANDSETSKIAETVKVIEKTNSEIDKINKQCKDLNKLFKNFEIKAKPVKSKVREYIDKINLLEKTLDYIKVLKNIENISNNIEAGINDKNDRKCTNNYVLLTDMLKVLLNSNCHHLVLFLKETIHYWHNILKERFSAEYEEVLKGLKWPFVGNNVLVTQSIELVNNFQMLTEHLLQIQLPEDTHTSQEVSSALLTDFSPLSLPMLLLIRSLRKRFLYHFSGSRQTNRADKPEWFFTQVLTWVRQHQDFIEVNIQPSYSKLGRVVLAKHELMRGLIQTVVEKLHSEIQYLQCDDSMFSHLVDETLGFDREMRESYGYPVSEPGVVGVLTAAPTFIKWLSMEKKYALEKMDAILSSESSFKPLLSSEGDEFKITECADNFLNLLTAITERYKILTQPGHRVQFLQLQLDLMDDFRVRLLQMLRQDEDVFSLVHLNILNTVHYVYYVLDEWGSSLHFLHLRYYQQQLERAESNTGQEDVGQPGTVFHGYLKLLANMKECIVNSLCENVLLEVKARSRTYRTEKWFALDPQVEQTYLNLTPSACPIFESLTTHLHKLNENLAVPLFKQCWTLLADSLDVYLYEEVVSVNCFNEGGAMQFKHDVTRNLLPLFGQYFTKSELHFKRLHESCFLLSMPRGTALLLLNTLEEADGCVDYDKRETLRDVGVMVLTVQDCLEVLNSRTDLLRS